MAAVAPAGIPVMRTLMPRAVGSKRSSRPTPRATAGRPTRRSRLNSRVSRLKIERRGTSTRMVPTMNILSAELQFPMYLAVLTMTAGGIYWVTMHSRPR